MIIFNGYQQAAQKEQNILVQVEELRKKGKKIKIASVLFSEDSGSNLYTQLKQQAAQRVGIEYVLYPFSLLGKSEEVVQRIKQLNHDSQITGIIIQKPWQKTWQKELRVEGEPKDVRQAYTTWWHYLTLALAINKDVDGLHPQTLAAIKDGTWQEKGLVLPATAKAVLEIMSQIEPTSQIENIAIIGRSELLGLPLFYELKNQKKNVQLMGQVELEQLIKKGDGLKKFTTIISATGHKHLINDNLISPNTAIIDVGEPFPDVDAQSLVGKVRFITPVPGGVGPMTVVTLLENSVRLASVA